MSWADYMSSSNVFEDMSSQCLLTIKRSHLFLDAQLQLKLIQPSEQAVFELWIACVCHHIKIRWGQELDALLCFVRTITNVVQTTTPNWLTTRDIWWSVSAELACWPNMTETYLLWRHVANMSPTLPTKNTIHLFWASWTILCMEHIEHENNVEDDFTEDEHTFLVAYSCSPWDKSFSSVSSTLIINILHIIKFGMIGLLQTFWEKLSKFTKEGFLIFSFIIIDNGLRRVWWYCSWLQGFSDRWHVHMCALKWNCWCAWKVCSFFYVL